MSRQNSLVSQRRNYLVLTVSQARDIVLAWLTEINLHQVVTLGLPEVDDRYHHWRVPLCSESGAKIGEAVIDAYSTELLTAKTTKPDLLTARLLKQDESVLSDTPKNTPFYQISHLRNTLGQGDCVDLMTQMPAASVDLIFTALPAVTG